MGRGMAVRCREIGEFGRCFNEKFLKAVGLIDERNVGKQGDEKGAWISHLSNQDDDDDDDDIRTNSGDSGTLLNEDTY